MVALAGTAAAAGPRAVGSLVDSRNATLDGQRPLDHTVLLNGDRLQVNGGLALVMLERGNHMVLGGQAEASFLREARALTVKIIHGNLSLYHPADGSGLRIKAGGVTVSPFIGRKALAEIALSSGVLVVTAKDGPLKIEKDGTTSEVAKGHTVTIVTTTAGTTASALSGNLHLKHVLDHEVPSGVGSSGGGASAAAVAFAINHHRHHRHVSPIHPGR